MGYTNFWFQPQISMCCRRQEVYLVSFKTPTCTLCMQKGSPSCPRICSSHMNGKQNFVPNMWQVVLANISIQGRVVDSNRCIRRGAISQLWILLVFKISNNQSRRDSPQKMSPRGQLRAPLTSPPDHPDRDDAAPTRSISITYGSAPGV